MKRSAALLISLFAAPALGCAHLSPPFDKMTESQMTLYKLQNYEPPATAQPQTTPGVPNFLPPQLQQWAEQAQKMLPPGLIPPGLIPGTGPAQPGTDGAACAANPTTVTAQCFHGYRILGYQQVADPSLRKELAQLFGTEGNFNDRHDTCPALYPEFGVTMAQPENPMAPANVLVSMSCQRVQAFNFQWPYAKDGLKDETIKKFASILTHAFGQTN